MLTRQHVEALAQIVGKQCLEQTQHDKLVLDVARYLESENPRFHMSRFVQAAAAAHAAAMQLYSAYLGDDPDSWSAEDIARVQRNDLDLAPPICTQMENVWTVPERAHAEAVERCRETVERWVASGRFVPRYVAHVVALDEQSWEPPAVFAAELIVDGGEE